MRYRKLSDTGDYVFGQGASEFLVDIPQAVAQAVRTRLLLSQGEWFLDLEDGTPYSLILGAGTQNTYDDAIQARILETQGVDSIDDYASAVDPSTRKLSVACIIDTAFGQVTLQETIKV